MKLNHSFLFIFLILVACSTGRKEEKRAEEITALSFSVRDFNAITNFQGSKGLVTLDLDYSGAIENGFVIPSVKQAKEGVFVCNFSVKNTGTALANFYYKIYYQNESYKFNESDSSSSKENPFAAENFYGSWENTDITFRKSETIPAD